MPHIQSSEIEAEVEGSAADNEILECYGVSHGPLFPIYTADYPCDFDGERMHRNAFAQRINKAKTLLLPRRSALMTTLESSRISKRTHPRMAYQQICD